MVLRDFRGERSVGNVADADDRSLEQVPIDPRDRPVNVVRAQVKIAVALQISIGFGR
jgi:hypothetical protein